MFFWIEFGLSALSLALAYACPELGASWFQRAEQLLNHLAQKRGLSVLVVGLAALAARAALLPIVPIPQPTVGDEFGYLLLADTFAHGRVTNPTHPMWVHFESVHILWQPTYTAKFYPAQGLIMALGQVVMGHPFWGVWLSVGLMCAAICWMLQGWLPPGWALLGGLLAVIRLGTFSYWASSYWGGAVAATGGALVLGALPRLKRAPRVQYALVMGVGLALVASSRPYEGVFIGLPVAGALAVWMLASSRPPWRVVVRRVVTPLLLVLALSGFALGYYFWRTTGSPWQPPYLVDARTYNPVPYFFWPSLRPAPAYHHAVMRDYYREYVLRQYEQSRSLARILRIWVDVPASLGFFYLGPALALPVLLAMAITPYGLSWRDVNADTRFLLLVCGSAMVGFMLPIWFFPHYAAPITAAILALVLQALRYLRSQARQGRPRGLFISRAVPSVCLLMLLLRALAAPLRLPVPPSWPGESRPIWCSVGAVNLERATTLKRLERCDGPQLAIVRYGPGHNFHVEWVYNEADINAAKVIWARDMGAAENKELLDYFRDRHIWLVEADEVPPRVVLYNASP